VANSLLNETSLFFARCQSQCQSPKLLSYNFTARWQIRSSPHPRSSQRCQSQRQSPKPALLQLHSSVATSLFSETSLSSAPSLFSHSPPHSVSHPNPLSYNFTAQWQPRFSMKPRSSSQGVRHSVSHPNCSLTTSQPSGKFAILRKLALLRKVSVTVSVTQTALLQLHSSVANSLLNETSLSSAPSLFFARCQSQRQSPKLLSYNFTAQWQIRLSMKARSSLAPPHGVSHSVSHPNRSLTTSQLSGNLALLRTLALLRKVSVTVSVTQTNTKKAAPSQERLLSKVANQLLLLFRKSVQSW